MSKVSDKRKLEQIKNNDKFDIPEKLIRREIHRTWLPDCPQPSRSIFNYGDSRHDQFVTKAEIKSNNALIAKDKAMFQGSVVSFEPSRKHFDWVESPNKRVLASPNRLEITGKIGH